MSVLGWLFDTSMGCPGPQGHWPLWMTVLFHSSNLVIGIGQLSIPLMFVANWKYRRDGIKPGEIWSVLAFIPMMALSRLVRVLEVWGPPYHLTTILDVITAALTVHGAIRLVRLVRDVMKLPSRAEHHKALNDLQASLLREQVDGIEKSERLALVQKHLDRATATIRNELWMTDRDSVLQSLSEAASELKTEALRHGRG